MSYLPRWNQPDMLLPLAEKHGLKYSYMKQVARPFQITDTVTGEVYEREDGEAILKLLRSLLSARINQKEKTKVATG